MKSIEEQQTEIQEQTTRNYLLHKDKLKNLIGNQSFREYIYNILYMSGVLPTKLSSTCQLSSNELFFRSGVESVGKNLLNELMETDENFLSIILNEKRNDLYE